MADAVLIANDARFSRQSAIIHHDLAEAQCLVGGVGMLGGSVALALARCTKHVAIFDPDTVEDVNSGNQVYNGGHVGMTKVSALEALAAGLPVDGVHGVFPLEKSPEDLLPYPREGRKLVVVSGVDSFAHRASLANYARHHNADVFVDTRAMGELCIVLIVPQHQIERYLKEEVRRDEDVPDQPCGMNGTFYVGSYVAGRVVSALNAHFNGRRVPFIQVEDLSTWDVLRTEYSEEVPQEEGE